MYIVVAVRHILWNKFSTSEADTEFFPSSCYNFLQRVSAVRSPLRETPVHRITHHALVTRRNRPALRSPPICADRRHAAPYTDDTTDVTLTSPITLQLLGPQICHCIIESKWGELAHWSQRVRLRCQPWTVTVALWVWTCLTPDLTWLRHSSSLAQCRNGLAKYSLNVNGQWQSVP